MDKRLAQRLLSLNQHFKQKDIRKIQGEDFLEFCEKAFKNRIVKPTTTNRYRDDLVAICNFGARIWNLTIDTKAIPKRKVPTPKPRYLSQNEQERLLYAYNPLVQPIIYLLCFQGCRIGEAIRLCWEDVCLSERTITFWITKNDEPRTVPMHPRVYNALRQINRERTKEIFINNLGKPYNYVVHASGSPIKTAHRTAVRKANIRNFKVHNWRSHWASQMALKGASAYELMALGGWKSHKAVSHYVKLNPGHLRHAIERLE